MSCSGGVVPCSDRVVDTNKVGEGSHCCCYCTANMLCLAYFRGLRERLHPWELSHPSMYKRSPCLLNQNAIR